ncbi:MAG: bifunctional [glutamate--ammonia ligase]-adenylyl-L-tyrosine phosphorylase/[glutamate--ammonia-ligase] adenylyltransferase [Pseudomonadales bacterium]|jgi:glutamate-ammonia-ligase adenylyltransferase|nr:bifunctional [glutamate--ammonia ligase]-adenylyl-L-tyrosine phosphorylase/[glutamate--ammonia-ligase] adenylyltransferase [Pseudomonadales bacterium]
MEGTAEPVPAADAALLAGLPDALVERVATASTRLREAGVPLDGLIAADASLAPILQALIVGSDWAVDWLVRHPADLQALIDLDLHTRAPARAELRRALAAELDRAEADATLLPDGPIGAALRQFRHRQMIGVLLRDLSRQAHLDETTSALSELAEIVIDLALERVMRMAVAAWGRPADGPAGEAARLIVIAMGKLGAGELNLSSDVDLILAYAVAGTTDTGLTHQEFFVRVAQRLVGLLDTPTGDGFAFRVDLRLRPFGDSGPLVQHADTMLDYYEEQGRDWERYALIKARVIAGDLPAGEQLLAALRPFVYRRYLDFGAIEALRGMKHMIRSEVRRRGLEDDIKLGEGGIREIEFVAQVFQLIHGGRDARFTERRLRTVLTCIGQAGFLSTEETRALDAAYVRLRDLEHRLQALRDEQTQRLPRDPHTRARIAHTLGDADWGACAAVLQAHRAAVAAIFSALIRSPEEAGSDADPGDALAPWRAWWHGDPDAVPGGAGATVFRDPDAAERLLAALRARREEDVTQEVGRVRLDRVMPRLLAVAAAQPDPDVALARSLRLVEAVLRRTAYLVLLVENAGALEQLVRLAAASERMADAIARHPILLDELLDPRRLFTAPEPASLRAELTEQLRGVDEGDLERELDQLRYFKEATELRVAACEFGGILPLMKVSDALTWLAEVIVERVVSLAWSHTVAQHGRPCDADGQPRDGGFCVIAYGKLGGLELGWGSDLDLVFLHDLPTTVETEGPRAVSNSQFFVRLGQRIVHLLTTRTLTGVLYEVDVRLRPSGQSGLLVSSLEAFGRYQRDEAWTWEHQALVRARPVVGDEALREAFAAIRRRTLGQKRDLDALRREVVEMRQRMLAEQRGLRERPSAAALAGRTAFDLKQDPGGVVDIEFMVQYLVLGWAHAHPDLLSWTDAIRILETARTEGILEPGDAQILIESYKEFRAEAHRTSLANLPARTERPDLLDRADRVAALWDARMSAVSSGAAPGHDRAGNSQEQRR